MPVSERLFRKEGESIASLALLPDAEGVALIQCRWSTLKKVPAVQVWAQSAGAALISLLVLSSLLYAPVWTFRWLRGSLRNAAPLSLRVMPLVASLLLVTFDFLIGVGFWGLITGRSVDDLFALGVPSLLSVSIWIVSLAFPAAVTASLYILYHHRHAIGKHITTRIQDKPLQLEIVGVARDAQDHNFWSKPVRRFYVSYFQPIDGITAANFAIRTVGDPAALDALLRREVKALDGNLTVLRIREVKSLMDQSLVQERLIAKLSSFFGLLAATLAAIGLYGVMAYDVVQRTKEIGVRMALGAQKINILSLVVGQGMKLALAGLGAGVLAALALTRIVRSLLYGTTPTDPVTFIAVVLTLASVAILACWLPARRASKVDPMEALRYE